MSSGLRTSAKQLCRVGVILLLVVQALSSLLNNPLMNSYAEAIVNYASFSSVEEVRAAAARSIALRNKVAVAGQSLTDASTDAMSVPAEESALVSNASNTIDTTIRGTSEVGVGTEKSRIEVPSSVARNPIGSQLAALGNEALDDIRGGFEPANSNLRFSFGIERAVFINGELFAHTVLNLRDLQWVAGTGGGAPQVTAANAAAGALGVIQNGSGNSFTAQVGSNLAGTVVQNTLNNQTIQNVTTVNATVNSAQLFRSMSVQSAVQNGIVNSLRH